jgi:hypothetical protein
MSASERRDKAIAAATKLTFKSNGKDVAIFVPLQQYIQTKTDANVVVATACEATDTLSVPVQLDSVTPGNISMYFCISNVPTMEGVSIPNESIRMAFGASLVVESHVVKVVFGNEAVKVLTGKSAIMKAIQAKKAENMKNITVSPINLPVVTLTGPFVTAKPAAAAPTSAKYTGSAAASSSAATTTTPTTTVPKIDLHEIEPIDITPEQYLSLVKLEWHRTLTSHLDRSKQKLSEKLASFYPEAVGWLKECGGKLKRNSDKLVYGMATGGVQLKTILTDVAEASSLELKEPVVDPIEKRYHKIGAIGIRSVDGLAVLPIEESTIALLKTARPNHTETSVSFVVDYFLRKLVAATYHISHAAQYVPELSGMTDIETDGDAKRIIADAIITLKDNVTSARRCFAKMAFNYNTTMQSLVAKN